MKAQSARFSLAPAGACVCLTSALLALGCSSRTYFIGAGCPGADGPSASAKGCGSAGAAGAGQTDSGRSFVVDLDQSGASFLGAELELPAGALPALMRLRGEDATNLAWLSFGDTLTSIRGTAPALGLATPFTDGTLAVGLVPNSPSYVAESAGVGFLTTDDFALEVVLRAAPGAMVVDKRDGGVGWALDVNAAGALELALDDGQRVLRVPSEPLVTGAWHHCLFWVSRAEGGRADCNGRQGSLVDMSALGSLEPTMTAVTIGGSGGAAASRVELALFALYDAKPLGLGAADTWSAVSRQRFAALTGVSPSVALGTALPRTGLRASPAYLDIQRDSARQLFLVGPDWPRVACRTDAAGAGDCGYLSEPARTRWVPPEAAAWAASELAVTANQATFADGEQRMAALVPSSASAAHALGWTGTYGGARQALSFFARAESGRFVATSVSNRDAAIFDLRAGTVVSAPSVVRASIEPWGNGLFRCAYVFEPDPGALTYRVELTSDAALTPFSGDGASTFADIAGLQLDVGTANPGSLLAADTQPADQLSFIANDGNVPTSVAVSQALRVLLPAGPRLTDQAVLSLNLGGDFANQVQLYVTGDTSALKFWGLRGGDTHWAFSHPATFTDGLRHAVSADWDAGAATLAVDGVVVTESALLDNEPPFSLDRLDIGFSASASGSLEGLVAGIAIGEKSP